MQAQRLILATWLLCLSTNGFSSPTPTDAEDTEGFVLVPELTSSNPRADQPLEGIPPTPPIGVILKENTKKRNTAENETSKASELKSIVLLPGQSGYVDEFKDFGDQYLINQLILSGPILPNYKSTKIFCFDWISSPQNICKELGARIPTNKEWQIIHSHRDSIPCLQNELLISSTPIDQDWLNHEAYYFDGETGDTIAISSDIGDPLIYNTVRCIKDLEMKSE